MVLAPKLLVLEQICAIITDAELPALQLCLSNISSYLKLLRHYTFKVFRVCLNLGRFRVKCQPCTELYQLIYIKISKHIHVDEIY